MTAASPVAPRRVDRIPPPQPDVPEALALERDADARADRALSERSLSERSLATNGLEPAPSQPAGAPEAGFRGLGAGRPLPPHLAGRLSRALGVDLSPLRLHTGAAAAARAEAMGARAATAGTDIVLGDEAQDLSRPDAVQTVAHEAAHFAQRAGRPDLPPVLRQDKDKPGTGIGRAPPKADYSRGTGLAPEDSAVTFAFDSADLSPTAQADLRALAKTWTGPVAIDLHGYASSEGPGVYNLNLSAHRAVAVRRLLQPLLPEGSVIRLHAHGEITDFEPADGNRRVGIDVTEKAASTATPAQVPGLPKPAPTPPAGAASGPSVAGSKEAEPPPAAEPAEWEAPSPDAEEPAAPQPLSLYPRRFRIPLRRPLTLSPQLAGNFFRFPPLASDPAARIDYLPLARSAAAHGVSLIDLTGRGELEEAYALHRRLYPWIPESADEVDNWLLSKLVGAMTAQAATERALDAYLDREYPGPLQRLERLDQIDRAIRGEDEPFVIPPITVLELEFDLGLGVFRRK